MVNFGYANVRGLLCLRHWRWFSLSARWPVVNSGDMMVNGVLFYAW